MTKSKFRPKENPKKGGGRRGKKKDKLHLVFDPDSRKDYLTGFRKRKQQKKVHYETKMLKKVAEERQRIRAEAKKSVKNLSASHSILPEVEALLGEQLAQFSRTADSFEVGSKTVTISSLDTLRPFVPDDVKNESDEEEDGNPGKNPGEDEEDQNDPLLQNGKMKSLLKKSTNRLLQSSKVYKTAQKLKQKKSKRHQKNPNHVKARDAKDNNEVAAGKGGKFTKKGKGKSTNNKKSGGKTSSSSKKSKGRRAGR